MPTTPDPNLRNSLLFLTIFILAFFPSTFQLLLKPLLYPLELLTAEFPLSRGKLDLPVCNCCPRDDCLPSPSRSPSASTIMSTWSQKTFTLPSKSRGSYLITNDVLAALPEIREFKVGMLNLFIQHTSCGLSLNENCDPDVRSDMTDALSRLAPEDPKGEIYRHADEGLDDMPAHIKSSIVGASVNVPISDGRLALGTWQGIWYLEFREGRMSRRVVGTVQGERRK